MDITEQWSAMRAPLEWHKAGPCSVARHVDVHVMIRPVVLVTVVRASSAVAAARAWNSSASVVPGAGPRALPRVGGNTGVADARHPF